MLTFHTICRMLGDTTPSDDDGVVDYTDYSPVLIVIFLEFITIAISRAVIPGLLNDHFESSEIYVYNGFAEGCKGILSFFAAPALGAASDLVGRKPILLLCVVVTYTCPCP